MRVCMYLCMCDWRWIHTYTRKRWRKMRRNMQIGTMKLKN